LFYIVEGVSGQLKVKKILRLGGLYGSEKEKENQIIIE